MIFTAFILGITSSLHCLGMCGPLHALVQANAQRPTIGSLLYNSGRITTYTLFGIIFGSLGYSINLIGSQKQLLLFIGSTMLISSFLSNKQTSTIFNSRLIQRQISKLKNRLHSTLSLSNTFRSYLFGVLNGFIPCGMVYFALLAALAMPSFKYTILYMIFFGLGTVPLMVFSRYIGEFLKRIFNQFVTFTPSMITGIIGLLFIIKGLGLGIPFLSPNIDMRNNSEINCHKEVIECRTSDLQNSSK